MGSIAVAKDGPNIRLVVQLICVSVSSWFLSRYLNIDAEILVWLVAALLECRAISVLRKNRSLGWVALLALGLFSMLFTLSLILGEHIVVEDSYSGLSDVNYIAPYSMIDLFALFAIWPGVFAMIAAPISYVRNRCESEATETEFQGVQLLPLGVRWVVGLSTLIFLLWLPYLLVYWPGFIFGDSLSSINQALGNSAWSNHHPVAYTLFLWLCLKAAAFLGLGNTVGTGFSTILQTVAMAFCLGYLSRWVIVRGSLRPISGIGLALALGFCSYFASFSIALWKDPLFSCSCLVLSLCLADFVWSRGRVVQGRSWLALFSISSLTMVFLRNNGVFILVVVGACVSLLLVFGLLKKKRENSKRCLFVVAIIAAILSAYAVVTGPVYSMAGVQPSEDSEAVGIPLNQMARVAALDGEMTESDKEYLDSIIPFDEYGERYRPCCTDLLKWSEGFSNESLKNGMWEHWASMLVRNPNAYFQAWELQTFGFWAVNTEAQAGWSWNVSGGAPRNTAADGVLVLNDLDIYPSSLALSEKVAELFPMDSWSLPISWLFWLVCYLVVVLALTRRPLWIMGIVPSLVLVLTLLVASPICYWPRYGALLQLAVPYYLLILLLVFVGKPASGKGFGCRSVS